MWRRLLCAFGRVGLLIMAVTALFVVLAPTCTNLLFRRKFSQIPGMYTVVQPLADYTASDAPGTTLSFDGFEFDVPWKSGYKTRTANKRVQGFEFATGQSALLWVAENQDGLLTEAANDQSMHMEGFRSAFPKLIKQSAYDQYSTLLNITPASIHPFGPIDENARATTLLMLKAIAPPGDIKSGAYSFKLPDKRGFQLGNPSATSHVCVEVFDLNGHNLEIFLSEKVGTPRITQPEVNRIIESLHTVPERASGERKPKDVALARRPQSSQD